MTTKCLLVFVSYLIAVPFHFIGPIHTCFPGVIVSWSFFWLNFLQTSQPKRKWLTSVGPMGKWGYWQMLEWRLGSRNNPLLKVLHWYALLCKDSIWYLNVNVPFLILKVLLSVYGYFTCMNICAPQRPEESIRTSWDWSYRQVWATMWVLTMEPRSSARAAYELSPWAIFPALCFKCFNHHLYLKFYACIVRREWPLWVFCSSSAQLHIISAQVSIDKRFPRRGNQTRFPDEELRRQGDWESALKAVEWGGSAEGSRKRMRTWPC